MIQIHTLTPADWQRLQKLRLRALRDAPDAFWSTLDEEAELTPAQWRERLEHTDMITVVAVDADRDVGLAAGLPHYDDPSDAGLVGLWVAAEARGRGAGAALIAAVIAWARAAGHRRVRLDVGDTNAAAQQLYASAGFTATGHTGRFLPPRDHITEHELAIDL